MKILKISALLVVVSFVLLLAVGFYALSRLGASGEAWTPPIAAAPATRALPAAPCADNNPLRNAYFGDLHVHTAFSWDGSGRGMYTTPDQAYRFARGEAIGLPPYDDDGIGLRSVQLERPLDFAAVTDHAESIGEVNLCITQDSKEYGSDICRAFRREAKFGFFPKGISPMAAMMSSTRSEELCGANAANCRAATLTAWQTMQEAAEQWYDRSDACEFTSFNGYEYTWAPGANRVHRNVIFRNELVPELPISSIDEEKPAGLWSRLKQLCIDTNGDCDALAIPHNPNHSSGRMFPLSDPSESVDERRLRAQLSSELEPLMEMMQIKGESECRNGLWGVSGEPDEFCELEKWELRQDAKDCETGVGLGKSLGRGCVGRTDYARYAVAAGMQEQKQLGVNPYQMGFIGSTDTHNGTPGAVDEWAWEGSTGMSDVLPEKRLAPPVQRNPGGLVSVWAEENSRDALFDAMQRREVFATSGTRMTVRFFAGWENFADSSEPQNSWCERSDALQAAYSLGVPMGASLTARGDTAPFFAISAQRDPGTKEHPGNLLQRIQLIKMQVKEDGRYHQQVYDVAGGPNDASVELNSCTPLGPGADKLCTVWQDPDFNPDEPAAYYARVIENPSCRWTTWTCLSLPENERPAACSELTPTTQERAWSSPIWYTPEQLGNNNLN